MLLALLFPLLAFSSWKEVWEVKLPSRPVAALYSVANDEIFVSVQEGERALLRKVSPKGELQEKVFASEKGPAGPMRFYGDRVYWIVGDEVLSFHKEGGRRKKEGRAFGRHDLAIDEKGRIYTAGAGGVQGPERKLSDQETTGLFFLAGELYGLVAGKFVKELPEGAEVNLCKSECMGLERAPDGSWITAEGNLVKGKKTLARLSSAPGRIAYVYRRESKEDLLIVPLPGENKIKAFRAP